MVRLPNVLTRLVDGESLGTTFQPTGNIHESRKLWLLTDRIQGRLDVDSGASKVLITGGASLLPVGIKTVSGEFERGATVSIYNPTGKEIAHGLTNYSSDDLRQLCGQKSAQIVEILGYSYGDAVVHRNNMVVLK